MGPDSPGLVWEGGEGSGGCHYTVSPRYRAMYQYRPQNEDELELREGDRVDVMQRCDDGWFVGTCVRPAGALRAGRQGMPRVPAGLRLHCCCLPGLAQHRFMA